MGKNVRGRFNNVGKCQRLRAISSQWRESANDKCACASPVALLSRTMAIVGFCDAKNKLMRQSWNWEQFPHIRFKDCVCNNATIWLDMWLCLSKDFASKSMMSTHVMGDRSVNCVILINSYTDNVSWQGESAKHIHIICVSVCVCVRAPGCAWAWVHVHSVVCGKAQRVRGAEPTDY